jgi:predicted RNase H-like HicB family nuclease
MDLTFTAVFEEVPPEQGGGFVAYAEELPEAMTQGDTLDEARENLREAIQLMLEFNRDKEQYQANFPKSVIREKISIPAV